MTGSIYDAIGEEGFTRLVAAFYRQVPEDEVLAAMYPADDLAGAEQRLRDFLIFRFGGPPKYLEERGHPRLRMRHAPFAVGQQARDHWLKLMTNALEEAEIPELYRIQLLDFFSNVSTFLKNRE